MNAPTLLSRSSWFFSTLCIVHCLATPFLVLALPSLAGFFSETVEWLLVLLVVPVSAAAFVPTWLKHRNGRLLASFLVGLALILTSQTLFHAGHGFWRYAVMVTGTLVVAVTIYRNNRHTHVCAVPEHHHH